jgi:hypothetical protein
VRRGMRCGPAVELEPTKQPLFADCCWCLHCGDPALLLQALCLLDPKARNLLCRAQYLQLVTARACEAPTCLPAAMNTLLTLMQVRTIRGGVHLRGRLACWRLSAWQGLKRLSC